MGPPHAIVRTQANPPPETDQPAPIKPEEHRSKCLPASLITMRLGQA
jgi:hypothetical protein